MTASSWTLRRTRNSTKAVALSLLLFGAARAEAADDFAKRVTKAQNCYERKLYDCAINELEAAYLIRPMPALLLNIAHAYLDYGRPRDAIVYYDRYMSEEKNLAAEARADVEKFKRQAEEKLGIAPPPPPPPPPVENHLRSCRRRLPSPRRRRRPSRVVSRPPSPSGPRLD